eukprot:EG_transcript_42167
MAGYQQLSGAVQAQAGRQICEVWAMAGQCKFGAKCSKLHPVVVSQPTQAQPVLAVPVPMPVSVGVLPLPAPGPSLPALGLALPAPAPAPAPALIPPPAPRPAAQPPIAVAPVPPSAPVLPRHVVARPAEAAAELREEDEEAGMG